MTQESSSSSYHRKGILLAGGHGTRLTPTTLAVSKQLLPVFDKPLVYYPLATLMLAGIRNVLLITTPHDQPLFQRLLGDGADLGLDLTYAIQSQPGGLGEAFLIGESFMGGQHVALVLGDNLFYGQGLRTRLQRAATVERGATIFTYPVSDPSRYGVISLNDQGEPLSLEEKPGRSGSCQAVTGLYFYDPRAIEFAQQLVPSSRGELEITDINQAYLQSGDLHVEQLGSGFTWLDTGTNRSLLQAANLVETIQERQGLKIACVEEIAFRMGFIDRDALARLALRYRNEYGAYLSKVANAP